MSILNAVFGKCISCILFTKTIRSTLISGPPYYLTQKIENFVSTKMPYKACTMIVFNSQCLKITTVW